MKLSTLALSALFGSAIVLTAGCADPMMVGTAAGAAGTAAMADNGISMGAHVDDQVIQSRIDEYLLKIPQHTANETNINATVYAGRALLLGQVPTETLRNQIANGIAKIKDVQSVINQLTVGPKQPVQEYLHDSWITAAVKGNMIGHIDPFHYKVVTEQGIVYLLGRVPKGEAQQATQIAAHTKGVKKVVTLFEITHPVDKDATTKNSAQNTGANKQYQVGSNKSD